MKRRIVVLALLISFTSFAFSKNFFDQRFFDFQTNVPITVTNNAFSLKDILKEELVIDLAKIADEMPKNGYSVITTVNPSFGWNLNIKDFHFSSFVGVDTFEKFTISKDLFEFFGYGNELYEDLSVAMTTNVDVFAHLDTKASFKAGDFGISIEPSFFLPVAHATTEESKIVVKNDAEGNLGTELIAKAALYTVADYENISDIEIMKALGFDLGGSFSFPFLDVFKFTGSFRTPIIPGHLLYKSDVTFKWSANTSLKDIASSGASNFANSPEQDMSSFEKIKYTINRPFRLSGTVDFKPMGDLVVLSSSLGLAVRNPFAKDKSETYCFPEFYLGGTISLANILVGKISTEYTDEVFKHTFGGTINLRVFQLDTGFSFASANLAKSFRGAGFGAYISTYIGF